MANFLAISAVTAALRHKLQEAIAMDVPGAQVTIERPTSFDNRDSARVNIFLYHITSNTSLQYLDLPTRGPGGDLQKQSIASIDLHYVLSFLGTERRLEPQRLLGSVTRTLHEFPVVTRDTIDQVRADPAFDFLVDSDLADQIEQVRLAPEYLSLEDSSKIWSVFFQTPYVLSVMYSASVVLLNGKGIPRPGLPVRQLNIDLQLGRAPGIHQLANASGPGQPTLPTSRLIIQGRELGNVVKVRIGNEERPPTDTAEDHLVIDLASFFAPAPVIASHGPEAQSASTLRAGAQGLQVIRVVHQGIPPRSREVASNAMPFILHPVIESVEVSWGSSPNDLDDPDDHPSGKDHHRDRDDRPRPTLPWIRVEFLPDVGEEQRVELILTPPPGHDGSFYQLPHREASDPPRSSPVDTLVFPAQDIAPGEYLVRIRIDGATSPLEVDGDRDSPTFNQYIAPRVTLP